MCALGPSNLEFYQAIAQVIGWAGEFAFDLSKPSGMDAKMVDASLLRSWHGPVDFDLRKGIEIAIKYYEESLL